MTGVQVLIIENGTSSWCTRGRPKGVTNMDILPPVKKSTELQARPLKIAKNFNKIAPSSKVLPKSCESFECPGVGSHRSLDRSKRRLGRHGRQRILKGGLDRRPSDRKHFQQFRIDNMGIRSMLVGSPHHLLNGASKNIRWDREIRTAQRDPGKVGKCMTIWLRITNPFMGSPEAIRAYHRLQRGRGGGNGVDIGAHHEEPGSPLVSGGPAGIYEVGERGHSSLILESIGISEAKNKGGTYREKQSAIYSQNNETPVEASRKQEEGEATESPTKTRNEQVEDFRNGIRAELTLDVKVILRNAGKWIPYFKRRQIWCTMFGGRRRRA
jgi:hypothetical protein